MSPRPKVLLTLLLLVSSSVLAGCLGASTEEAPPADDALDNSTNETDATLPDGRGESLGNLETNKTEEGVGGIEHKHDYWQGRERVVVFDEAVYFNFFPVYPDGEGTNAKSVAYLKLPQPNLVYEGTSSVEILVEPGPVSVTGADELPNPSPPQLALRYRTAAGEGFIDGGQVQYGTPVVLSVAPKETDMPHSVSSLWAFSLVTDRPDYVGKVDVTITIVKGNNVVDWPGHPDFYAETHERVVLDKSVKVHRSGAQEAWMYGAASSWIEPDKLISYGTGRLDVFVNVTSAQASNGAKPTGFFLEYHNATILHAEDDYNDRVDDETKGRQFDRPDYHFVVPVDPAGMDGPYQPSSRWGFRMVATFAETPAFSLCPGCFPYDIDFTIKVVAHKTDDEQARLNE